MIRVLLPKARRHPPNSRSRGLIVGGILVGLGIAFIGASVGYVVFSLGAKASLGGLVVNAPSESAVDTLPDKWRESQTGAASGSATPAPAETTKSPGADAPPRLGAADYRWADWNTLPRTMEQAPASTRVVIPAIGVDSPVVHVSIVKDQGEWIWQRPGESIGHHAGTANPGEVGNSVISGHINSPVRGEGSVFKRLPEIPKRIQAGEAVEVFVFTEDKTYVYRLVASDVVKPEDVRLFDPTDRPTLTVITCVPDLVFSDRLVITGLLIKVADRGYPSAGQRVDGVTVWPR